MAKSKYRFNQETLSYEKIVHSPKKIIITFFSYLVLIVFVGFTFMFTWLHFFPSAREKQLMDENKMLRSRYKTLNGRMANLETVLNDLADKDNNIYRMVFEITIFILSEKRQSVNQVVSFSLNIGKK